jgi:serine O-acetyltransferase
MDIIKLHKISNKLYQKRLVLFAKCIQKYIRVFYSCYLPYTCIIGENTHLYHGGLGVAIHENSMVGTNCHIYTCVTLGGTNNRHTRIVIGDNVMIGTGAKIIGNIKIGNNVVIAANSVVLEDIPNDCLVVGVPGTIKKIGIDIFDYIPN